MDTATMTKDQAVKTLADHHNSLKEMGERIAKLEATNAELDERADKWEREFIKAHEALVESRRVAVHRDGSPINIPPDADFQKGHRHLVRSARPMRSGEPNAMAALKNSDLGRYMLMNDALCLLAGACDAPHRPGKMMKALKSSPLWQEFIETGQRLGLTEKASYDTTQDSGWVPTYFSNELIEPIRDASRLYPLFRSIPMPGKNFTLPAVTADRGVYIASEVTSAPDDSPAPSKVTSAKATSGSVTLNAVKLGTRAVYSIETLQNATFDFAMWVVMDLARALGEDGIDAAIINGDATTAHMDTGAGYAATAPERVWNGLRYLGIANSYTTSGSGTFSEAVVASARGAMGQYGGFSQTTEGPDTVLLVSYKAFAKMQTFTNVAPSYAYGPRPGVLTGEAALLFGMPVIPTQHINTTYGTDGLDETASEVLTGALLVHRPGFLLGELRDIEVRSSDVLYMEYDQVVSVAFWQGDFEPKRPIASNRMVEYIINI